MTGDLAWWQGFPGWAITTGLAAVAALGVVVETVQRRRSRPRGALSFTDTGTASVSGAQRHLVTVENPGTALVHVVGIWTRGASARFDFPDGLYRIPKSVPPGGSCDLLLEAAPGVYFLAAWRVSGRAELVIFWQPLETAGPLREEWASQAAKLLATKWKPWARWRWWRRGVGPGGVVRVVLRGSTEKRKRKYDAAFAEPDWQVSTESTAAQPPGVCGTA